MNRFTKLFEGGLRSREIDHTHEKIDEAKNELRKNFYQYLYDLADRLLSQIPAEEGGPIDETKNHAPFRLSIEDLRQFCPKDLQLTDDQILEALNCDPESLKNNTPLQHSTPDKKTTFFSYQFQSPKGLTFFKKVTFGESDHPKTDSYFEVSIASLKSQAKHTMEQMVDESLE